MFRHDRRKQNFLLIGVLLLAFVLRIVAIDQVPPGLSHDEAYNGVTAMQVMDGQHRIFFEINKGIEPLIIYLEALAFYGFGVGPVPLRLVNVFCGLLTVALVYPLASRLFNRRVALLAMTGLAISFWSIFVSRLTLRAVTFPPLLMLTLYFLERSLNSISNEQLVIINYHSLNPTSQNPKPTSHIPHLIFPILFLALSGLVAGVSMYTYLSSRFVPLLVIAIFGYQLVRGQMKGAHWWGLLIHFAIWVAIFAPLANYYQQNAASFTERYNQVATIPYALNGEFGPLIDNTLRTLGMFTFHGDETDRYNLDGRPVFDWVNGLFFYLGIGIVLWRLRGSPGMARPAALLLLWLMLMLLPDFITDDSPHFLRTIGAMPAVYIFWALGIEWLNERMSERRMANHIPLPASRFPLLLILILLLLTTVHTIYDYFGRWTSASEARYIYGADMAEVAGYVQATQHEGLVAISAAYYRDLDPFRFALYFQGHPPFVIWFDGRQSLAFPPPESGLWPRYLFSTSAPPANIWLSFLQPSPAESGREYTLYRLPDDPALQPDQTTPLSLETTPLGINVNNELVLSAYQVLGAVISGGKFQVLLGWQALRRLPPGTDYTFLVRLRDRQGHLWAEADGNGYPPPDWQPGIQGWQLLTLRLSADLPPRAYPLTVEVIDRHKGQPLPTSTGETVVPLTTLTGHLADTPRIIDSDKLPNPIPPPDSEGVKTAELALRGYRINNATLRFADRLSLALHWQVLKQPQQNYRLIFFLVNDLGDSPPVPVYQWPAIEPIGGEWPTSQWATDYWVQDKVDLLIGPDIPAGQFKLRVGLVDVETGQPSPVYPDEITLPSFELGSVTIEPRQ